MEGYSVTEAASVLGVPTERVWELLARGVLSGVPDGETGMRVFLQPRPAPPAVEEPRRSNGHSNARETDGEASPFRELLTEFRGLTERYGQALLALGEARGEVASLRSRVDVLEARMDLRLPYASPPSSDPGWGGPSRTSSEPRPRGSEHPGAEVDDEPEVERSPRRKRGRGHATDEFADALARAEDPNPAVLRDRVRGAPAAAVQPDRDEAIAEADVADTGLPRELPPAETMADIEPEAEPAIVEPVVVTHDAEPEGEPELAAEVERVADTELATEPQAQPLPEPEPDTETAAELTTELRPLEEPEPGPEAALEPAAEFGTELQPEPDAYLEAEVALESEPVPAVAEAPGAEAGQEAEPPFEGGLEPEPLAAGTIQAAAEIEPQPEAEPEPVAQVDAEPEPALADLVEAGPEPASEPEPVPAAQVAVEADHEPELELEAEAPFETGPELEPVAAEALPAETATQAQRESEPEPAAAEAEPNVAVDIDELPEAELELEPEPSVVGGIEAAAVDQQEPDAEPEAAIAAAEEGTSEPSWDQERYSAQIEEPDWWTPEESVWAEPEVASDPESVESGPDEPAATIADSDEPASPSDAVTPPSPAEDMPAAAEADEERPSADVEVAAAPPIAAPESVATEGSSESDSGEETMLWFGQRPAGSASGDAPSDDAAGEMEVASTGRRGWVSPEDASGGMPGAEELDEALVGLDALRRRTAPTAAGSKDPLTAAVPPPGRPSSASAATSDAPSVVSAELRGPASRAYRRLRRIFPT